MAVITSPTSTTASVTPTPTSWWLKDPLDPASGLAVTVRALEVEHSRPADVAQFSPLGRSTKVVLMDALRGEEFTYTLLFRTEAEFVAFEALRARRRTLLLQSDGYRQWYVRIDSGVSAKVLVTRSRATAPIREVTVPFIEVSAP